MGHLAHKLNDIPIYVILPKKSSAPLQIVPIAIHQIWGDCSPNLILDSKLGDAFILRGEAAIAL